MLSSLPSGLYGLFLSFLTAILSDGYLQEDSFTDVETEEETV